MEQPECPIHATNSFGLRAIDVFSDAPEDEWDARPRAVIMIAAAQRERWSPLRAAWTGAVEVATKYRTHCNT
jgi:hypothetical protein